MNRVISILCSEGILHVEPLTIYPRYDNSPGLEPWQRYDKDDLMLMCYDIGIRRIRYIKLSDIAIWTPLKSVESSLKPRVHPMVEE